jgi:hypothetical protein
MDEHQQLIIRFNRDYPPLRTQGYTQLKINFGLWLTSEDPDYLDKIVIVMNTHSIEIKGVILEQLAIASLKRLKREFHYGKKTKVNKDVPADQANWQIFKLIHFCDYTLGDATILAAGWLDKTFPEHSLKASVLDKRYPNWAKTNKDSIDYVKSIREDGWGKEEQNKFLSFFPEYISDSLKGNRRD